MINWRLILEPKTHDLEPKIKKGGNNWISNVYNTHSSYDLLKDDKFKKLNEEFTIDKFVNILYNKLNYTNSCPYLDFKSKLNTNNLAFSLPGHNLNVPWYILGKLTADILIDKQYQEFSKFI